MIALERTALAELSLRPTPNCITFPGSASGMNLHTLVSYDNELVLVGPPTYQIHGFIIIVIFSLVLQFSWGISFSFPSLSLPALSLSFSHLDASL